MALQAMAMGGIFLAFCFGIIVVMARVLGNSRSRRTRLYAVLGVIFGAAGIGAGIVQLVAKN